jgi:HD-like signal output (HDOD) protein
VERLSAAVSQLGARTVRDLAVASTTAAEIYADLLPWSDGDLAWRRGLAGALACERLNREMSINGEHEAVFLAALLRPLGRAQLASMYSREYERLVATARDSGEPLKELERRAFSLAPEEVLARLLARWSVSPAVCEMLELASLDFAALERLPAVLKQRIRVLKVASYLGELAVGSWEPWDTLEVLPEQISAEVCSVVPASVVRRVRGDLTSLALLRRMNSPAERKSAGEIDGSEPALVNLGQPAVEAVERFVEAFAAPRRFLKLPTRALGAYLGPLLINACCASPVELRRLADTTFYGPRLIVKARGKARLHIEQAEVLELPCSWQTFRQACDRLLAADVPTSRSPLAVAGTARMAPVADAVLS